MLEESNEPRITEQAARGQGFRRMVIISLLVHASVTAVVLSQKNGATRGPSVSYLDLRMLQPAAPVLEAPRPTHQAHTIPLPQSEPPAVQPESPPTAYDTLQQEVNKALQSAESRPEAVNGVSFGLGMTNGYFSTLAEGKTLRPDIREYYLALLQRVNEKWWVAKNGQTGWVRDAIIDVVVSRDGTVVHLSLTRSSGNPAWDRAMLKSLEAASPLPPLPESYTDEFFRAPLRFVAPLNLMTPAYSGGSGGNDHSDSSSSSSSRSRS